MKRILKPVRVTGSAGRPEEFSFGERTYHIEAVEDRWMLQGNWWLKEEKRRYFRVRTDRGVAVLYLREVAGEAPHWILEQLFD